MLNRRNKSRIVAFLQQQQNEESRSSTTTATTTTTTLPASLTTRATTTTSSTSTETRRHVDYRIVQRVVIVLLPPFLALVWICHDEWSAFQRRLEFEFTIQPEPETPQKWEDAIFSIFSSSSVVVNATFHKNVNHHHQQHNNHVNNQTHTATILNCSYDFWNQKTVLDTIQVLPFPQQVQQQQHSPHPHDQPTSASSSPPPPPITVLCYILCNSDYHPRVKVIQQTWGSHCDGFFVASDQDDADLGAVAIPLLAHGSSSSTSSSTSSSSSSGTTTNHTWHNLWEKQRETIRYLHDHNISQHYDWIFKADTDSFVIVENLKAHLVRIPNATTIPQLVGHKLYLPKYKRRLRSGSSSTSSSSSSSSSRSTTKSMIRAYHELQTKADQWMYANGGGYAMNQNFMDKFVRLVQDDPTHCFPNQPELPEDFATAACVASHYPLSPLLARDAQGLDLYHIYPPRETAELGRTKQQQQQHEGSVRRTKRGKKKNSYYDSLPKTWQMTHPSPYNPIMTTLVVIVVNRYYFIPSKTMTCTIGCIINYTRVGRRRCRHQRQRPLQKWWRQQPQQSSQSRSTFFCLFPADTHTHTHTHKGRKGSHTLPPFG
jgi:hypothetical protein